DPPYAFESPASSSATSARCRLCAAPFPPAVPTPAHREGSPSPAPRDRPPPLPCCIPSICTPSVLPRRSFLPSVATSSAASPHPDHLRCRTTWPQIRRRQARVSCPSCLLL